MMLAPMSAKQNQASLSLETSTRSPLHVVLTSEDFSRGRWTGMTNEPIQFCFLIPHRKNQKLTEGG